MGGFKNYEPKADEPAEAQADNYVPPEAIPWIDIEAVPEDDQSVVIGPGRWLTRGSGCFIVANTGAGKSTLSATMAFTFGLGRECLGFRPNGKLRSLVIQSEDDDGDLAEMKSGIIEELNPDASEIECLRKNVIISTERAMTGLDFLDKTVVALLELHQSIDLLWLNPVSAFFGGDLNKQQEVAAFFRNRLNPILAQYRCAAFCVHHTAKPSKDRKGWIGGEQSYLGSGSADLANWSRETLALMPAGDRLFTLTATKRWRRLGWRDAEGKLVNFKHLLQGKDGRQYWRLASGGDLEDLGVNQYSDAAAVALVPAQGIDKAELVKLIQESFSVENRTARNYLSGLVKPHLRLIDGRRVRSALLISTARKRREVYPESIGGRDVVWITRPQNEGQEVARQEQTPLL